MAQPAVWDRWTLASVTTKAGFPFRSCSSSRGQGPCELQAIRSCPDEAGKLASPPCLGPLVGSLHRLWPSGQLSLLSNASYKGLRHSCWAGSHCSVWAGAVAWGGGQRSSFTFSRKCRGCWLALAPTLDPSFRTSHDSSDQVWFSCSGSPPPSGLSLA